MEKSNNRTTYTAGGRVFLGLMGCLFCIMLVFELMYIIGGGYQHVSAILVFGFSGYITFLCFYAACFGQAPVWHDDRSIFQQKPQNQKET